MNAGVAQRQLAPHRLLPALVLGAIPLIALGLAWNPLLTAGLVLGAAVFAVTLQWPLAVVGVMIAIGPLDLSFVTGGFKGFFVEFGGLDMNGIRLIGVVISVAAVSVVNRDLVRDALSHYGRWYALFLVVAAGSIAYSIAPLEGARLLLKLAYPFLVFLVVAGVSRTEHELRRVLDAALIGGVVIALLLMPALIAFGQYHMMEGRLVIPAVGGHQNPLSFYMLMMLLIAVGRFASRGGPHYLLAAALFGTWMALTITRITFGAALIGLAGLGTFAALATRNYRALAAGLVVGVLLALPALPFVMERTFGRTLSGMELMALLRDPVSLYYVVDWQGRQVIWPLAVQAFVASPILGLGLGASTGVIAQGMGWTGVMHNEYLRLAVDTGVVGSVLFATAILVWGFGILKAARQGSELARESALAAAGGIVAWSVIAFTDNPFDYYGQFTQYIGLLVAVALAAAGLVGRVEREASG